MAPLYLRLEQKNLLLYRPVRRAVPDAVAHGVDRCDPDLLLRAVSRGSAR